MRNEKAVSSEFAGSLYFAAGALARAVGKLAADCWRPSGLPPSQAIMLLHVIGNCFAFSYFISGDLQVNPSSVTRLADALVAKGYVERFTEDHCTYLSATNKARALEHVLLQCQQAFHDRCTQILGYDRLRAMATSLNLATDKISEQMAPKKVLAARPAAS
ncbi:MAG TPA: MarR family transcriptional regulator [Puia sp.]|nr:MarR family transcriptional regulator [Puia sp.]